MLRNWIHILACRSLQCDLSSSSPCDSTHSHRVTSQLCSHRTLCQLHSNEAQSIPASQERPLPGSTALLSDTTDPLF